MAMFDGFDMGDVFGGDDGKKHVLNVFFPEKCLHRRDLLSKKTLIR